MNSIYDPDETKEEELWFSPAPPEGNGAEDVPWPVAAQEASLSPAVWLAAEQNRYRELLDAAVVVERFAERLRHFPEQVKERFALSSVSAVLRSEGIWLGPEQIALYRSLRLTSDDTAQDLSRASWAVRRLIARHVLGSAPTQGVHHFLGRSQHSDPSEVLGEGRATGTELEAIGQSWARSVEAMSEAHSLTQAAYAFAQWRSHDITPWDELLEPTIAAMILGRGGTDHVATFLPISESHRFDRHSLEQRSSSAEARLTVFFEAIRQGALNANMELDRLATWKSRADEVTRHLSGRTPTQLLLTMMKFPIVSAELVSQDTGCSRPSARRNLNLFSDMQLIHEVTGQDRYRFWAIRL